MAMRLRGFWPESAIPELPSNHMTVKAQFACSHFTSNTSDWTPSLTSYDTEVHIVSHDAVNLTVMRVSKVVHFCRC